MTRMTSKTQRALGEIAAAAHALESDLEAFEAAAGTALRLPLASQRNLGKATHAINEAADSQRRIGEHIHVLMAALNAARERNQATSETLAARGVEIQAKADEHGKHLAAFHAIGQAAKEISDAVRTLGSRPKGDPEATAAQLAAIEQRMTGVVDEAQALMKSAREASLGELARDVEALFKQVQSARNKVALVRGKLGAG
jgi:hypothetical protein